MYVYVYELCKRSMKFIKGFCWYGVSVFVSKIWRIYYDCIICIYNFYIFHSIAYESCSCKSDAQQAPTSIWSQQLVGSKPPWSGWDRRCGLSGKRLDNFQKGSTRKLYSVSTLPETNSSHLKMDGWNTSFLLGWPIFRGYLSFREGNDLILYVSSVVNFQGRKWIFYVFLCGYRADSRAEKS